MRLAVHRRGKPNVDLPYAGVRNDRRRILDADAASGHDDSASARRLNEFRDGLGPLKTVLLSTRGKNSVGTGGANIFKSLE